MNYEDAEAIVAIAVYDRRSSPERFSCTDYGREAYQLTALWVLEQCKLTGWTLDDYFERRCSMAQMGISKTNAIETLQPLIPEAHLRYNESHNSRVEYTEWSLWFDG